MTPQEYNQLIKDAADVCRALDRVVADLSFIRSATSRLGNSLLDLERRLVDKQEGATN